MSAACLQFPPGLTRVLVAHLSLIPQTFNILFHIIHRCVFGSPKAAFFRFLNTFTSNHDIKRLGDQRQVHPEDSSQFGKEMQAGSRHDNPRHGSPVPDGVIL
ncbi:hypothetical protein BaRGS_00006897 [Batillaria attramentaria]|uniref:Uncharacterized protein n=1 Tax=Batillaria attramentaria TaxID=370345 RepID=A0ABD0LRL1_9CAEN